MKFKPTNLLLLFPILFFTACATSVYVPNQELAEKSSRWVFTNVNIVDVKQLSINSGHDVYIDKGKIEQIIPHSDEIDSEYQMIDASEYFLSPGLIDSHVHLYSKTDLVLYVANGVTSVQNMWGFEGAMTLLGVPNSLDLKQHVDRGGFGPAIWTAGPIMEGEEKTHPFMSSFIDQETAQKEVQRQFDLGYDWIKTYDWLSPDVFTAIMEKALELDIPVKGHVPLAVPLDDALAQGMHSIEHLSGWIDIDSASLNYDEDKLIQLAKIAKQKNVSVCPSLLAFQYVMPEQQAETQFKDHPYRKFLSSWDKWLENKGANSMRENVKIPLDTYAENIRQAQEIVLQVLVDHGVNIVACTDAGNPYLYPGISLHEEMAQMQAAGLTAATVLQSATLNAAIALAEQDQRGQIKEGFIADLVLTKQNPLDDVRNLRELHGVMLRGKWFNGEDLNGYLHNAEVYQHEQ